MNRVLHIPGPGRYFEGHFPGRPILPGIAILALVARALDAGPVRGIAHARFRSPITPGEVLALDARPEAGEAMRVALRRDAALVMNAVLDFSAPQAAPRASCIAGLARRAPSLEALLPHRPPMRFVTAVLAQREDGADCLACVPAGCALVEAGEAPALAVLEAAAQTAAVWEALRREALGGAPGPQPGYLVALRDVTLYRERIPADAVFTASVRLEAVAMPLTHYRADVSLDGDTVLSGLIATVLA